VYGLPHRQALGLGQEPVNADSSAPRAVGVSAGLDGPTAGSARVCWLGRICAPAFTATRGTAMYIGIGTIVLIILIVLLILFLRRRV
jgi:hypothetical protein